MDAILSIMERIPQEVTGGLIALLGVLFSQLLTLYRDSLNGKRQGRIESQIEEKRRETELIKLAVSGVANPSVKLKNLRFFGTLGLLSADILEKVKRADPGDLPDLPLAGPYMLPYATSALRVTAGFPCDVEGSRVRMAIYLGTGPIPGGTRVTISTIRVHLDCDGLPPTHPDCIELQPSVAYDGNLTTDLVTQSGTPVYFLTRVAPGEKSRDISFEMAPPLDVPENCTTLGSVDFDLQLDSPRPTRQIPFVVTLVGRIDNGSFAIASDCGFIPTE